MFPIKIEGDGVIVCTAVQQGAYADEGLRFCESLRRFHSAEQLPLCVFHPNSSLHLDSENVRKFEALGATLLRYDEHWTCDVSATNRKLAAMSQFERFYSSEVKRVIWCDADIICLAEVSELLAVTSPRLSVCPVRGKGVGLRLEEPLTNYWRSILRACGSEGEGELHFAVVPTHGGRPIRPYFNSGVIGYPVETQIFSRAFSSLQQVLTENEMDQWTSQEKYYLEQAILSETILTLRVRVPIDILHPRWNCSMKNVRDGNVRGVKLIHHNHQLSPDEQLRIEQRFLQ